MPAPLPPPQQLPPAAHLPWRRLLALNIVVLVLVLLAVLKELPRHPLFRAAKARRSHWELRGAARALLARSGSGGAETPLPLPLPPPRRRADGLGALWDPACQLPREPQPQGDAPFVELCVSSELSQRLRRDAIRAGYGRYAAGLNASLRFFVGQPAPGTHDAFSIESERRQHGDLVILPFRDSYENLTLKSLAMLSYSAACGSARYVVKLDDDVMVYLAHLRRFLEKMDADAVMAKTALGVYSGTLWVNTPPILAKGNKNEESNWVLASLPRNASADAPPPEPRGKHFFPYAGGPFYLMSRAAAEYLRANAHRLNWKWRNEDMAVGTWFIGADIETINTFQVKVLHWRWSTKPFIALHNIDDRHRIAEWHLELGNSTLLLS
jgi:hypothetical protein